MRRVIAALALAGGVLATSPVAAHAVPVGVGNDHGCYYVWISAKTIPLICVSQS
ncbi:MAG TPA: hypothetical protein VFQ85_04530 [Mycobacteriales bacterium]|jgi:hypothetical protein|nr:hypothetical protein [Mycobacteriales bacterium]